MNDDFINRNPWFLRPGKDEFMVREELHVDGSRRRLLYLDLQKKPSNGPTSKQRSLAETCRPDTRESGR